MLALKVVKCLFIVDWLNVDFLITLSKKTFQIVNLNEIDKRYNDDETADEISLYEKGCIKGSKKSGIFKTAFPVKILGNGELSKKLKFKISAISGSAKEKIQKAGGELVSHG